jgi:ATP-binding cassette subfamily B protein
VKGRLRGAAAIARIAFRADPKRAVMAALLSFVTEVSFSLSPLWLKLLADSVLAGDLHGAVLVGAAAAAMMAGSFFFAWLAFETQMVLQERTNLLIDERLAELSLGMPGMEHHERPDYQNEMTLLREERHQIGQSLFFMLAGARMLLSLATTVVLLAIVHPVLVLLPLFGFALLATHRAADRLRQQAQESVSERLRTARQLFDLSTDAGPAKELHVFGLGGELLGRHGRLWREIDGTQTRARLKGALFNTLGWLGFAVGYGGAISFVVWLALRGAATPGDVLMALSLAAQVQGYAQWVAGFLSWFFRTLAAVGRFLWLQDYAGAAKPAIRNPHPVPERLEEGIEVEGLSFRYPGTEKDVLSGVNLTIPAGSTVAIVGENGAGKTTLVKLLCRFYEPKEGRILVDGVDLRRFDVEEWRARLSAAFQDFARLELLARETVGVGDLPELESEGAVEGALVRAGAENLPAALPSGLETQLGKDWEGGTDLSGGQWQKLALGRSMMRGAPLLLVLDEPTASLDAQTEHTLFERYARAARSAAEGAGTVTILVSHRFSTVRMADLILVVDGGRVREAGSHEELMATNGLYAELYSMQARAYR